MINNVFGESDYSIKNKLYLNLDDIFIISKTNEDIDPLINLVVTVEINEIRALDIIDKKTQPDFYLKLSLGIK